MYRPTATPMKLPIAPPADAGRADLSCKVCTIHLEKLCYPRAWWFRPFREVFATGIRVFALAHRLRPEAHPARSRMCHGCIRFRKNALKERSALFRRLDAHLNPVFNRARDALLTPGELERARELARRAGDSSFDGA